MPAWKAADEPVRSISIPSVTSTGSFGRGPGRIDGIFGTRSEPCLRAAPIVAPSAAPQVGQAGGSVPVRIDWHDGQRVIGFFEGVVRAMWPPFGCDLVCSAPSP